MDSVDGAQVAVKILWADAPSLPNLAEAAALRLLPLPGVVRLRETGEHEGVGYLAMDRVEGEPFPAGRPWTEVMPLLFRLLTVLAEVHALGVLHGDLKPEHALHRPDGQIVLIDFGLASGLRLGTRGDVAGTPGYAALELLRGQAPSPRTDLFAVGALAWHALTGELPWDPRGRGAHELATAMGSPPPPLRDRCPGLPSDVERIILDLLAPSAADRPVAADEAAARLQRALASSSPQPIALPPSPLSAAVLADLFWGPERLLHLPSDAADALVTRAGLDPDAIRAELHRWELLGLARRDGPRLRVTRPDLAALPWQDLRRADPRPPTVLPPGLTPGARDLLGWVDLAGPHATMATLTRALGTTEPLAERWLSPLRRLGLVEERPDGLLVDRTAGAARGAWDLIKLGRAHRRLAEVMPPGAPGRLRHLLAADALDLAAEEAQVLGTDLVERGRLAEAVALLEQAVRWARANGDAARESALLVALVPIALTLEAEGPAKRAAILLDAALEPGRVAPMRELVGAALAALAGDGGPSEALEALGPMETEDLEVWRRAVQARGALLQSLEAFGALLDRLERDWVKPATERGAIVAGWKANLLYERADYLGAAQGNLYAAQRKTRLQGRLSSWLNAAAAFLEADEHQEAERYARLGLTEMSDRRFPLVEARAVRLLRSAQLRSGAALAPDLELVEAAFALDDTFQAAAILQVEAAIAWRVGHPAASSIAEASANRYRQIQFSDGAVLMDALRINLGERTDLATAYRAALEMNRPLLRAQALGLLAARLGPEPRALEAVRPLTSSMPPAARRARREVLSVEESLMFLTGAGHKPAT